MTTHIINGIKREVETPEQVLTALFELACCGGTLSASEETDSVTGFPLYTLQIKNMSELGYIIAAALKQFPDVACNADMSNLPVFGGETPSFDELLLSWDEDRVLLPMDVKTENDLPPEQLEDMPKRGHFLEPHDRLIIRSRHAHESLIDLARMITEGEPDGGDE